MIRQDGAGRARTWFSECYGGAPGGIWQAPGRANLIGEHTDYNEGFVLPFAIPFGTAVAAAARDDGVLALRSRQVPGDEVILPPSRQVPGEVTGWAAYPAGVAWALRAAGHQVGGADLAIDSDLPQGAGLSSSAALECAVALALSGLHGLSETRTGLAAIARRAENDFVGVPSGIMDQSASLLCQAGHALLLDCRSQASEAVPLDPAAAGLALLLVDTRAKHTLADGGYAARARECQQAASELGVPSLRDVTDDPGAPGRLADPVLRRRARHVITENRRVLATVGLLGAGRLAEVGDVLLASHASLRDDFEISWPEANAAVSAAVRAGALGARMIGGGFGGSVLALTPADQEPVRRAVRAEFAGNGWREPEFLDCPPADGARRLR